MLSLCTPESNGKAKQDDSTQSQKVLNKVSGIQMESEFWSEAVVRVSYLRTITNQSPIKV